MTGKELMLYILQNNLEDKNVFEEGFMTVDELAAKVQTGRATIIAYISMGVVRAIKIGDEYLIPRNTVVDTKAKSVK